MKLFKDHKEVTWRRIEEKMDAIIRNNCSGGFVEIRDRDKTCFDAGYDAGYAMGKADAERRIYRMQCEDWTAF